MWGGAPLVKWLVRGCPPKNWGVPPYQMPSIKLGTLTQQGQFDHS